jgi:hypothetical protein
VRSNSKRMLWGQRLGSAWLRTRRLLSVTSQLRITVLLARSFGTKCRYGLPTGSGHSEIPSGCRRCQGGCPVRVEKRGGSSGDSHATFRSLLGGCPRVMTCRALIRPDIARWPLIPRNWPSARSRPATHHRPHLEYSFFHDAILNWFSGSIHRTGNDFRE